MALGQRLEIRQGQSLVMTPQLQQAIKLLQLSNIELAEYCEAELEKNPLLERDESVPRDAEGETVERENASEKADESLAREDFSKLTGIQDFEDWLTMAEEYGLNTIIRPGPYICAEWDNGAFPLWLAPVQIGLVPISERHIVYANKVEAELKAAGLRVEVDARNEKMNAKIRDLANQKTPYILVFGDKEEAAGSVSVRTRGKGDQGSIPLAEFIAKAKALVASQSTEL